MTAPANADEMLRRLHSVAAQAYNRALLVRLHAAGGRMRTHEFPPPERERLPGTERSGYITLDGRGGCSLTRSGRKSAQRIQREIGGAS